MDLIEITDKLSELIKCLSKLLLVQYEKFCSYAPATVRRSNFIQKIEHLFFLTFISFSFLKILFIYLRERVRVCMSRGRGTGRGRSRLPTEQGAWWEGLIPGPWDHDLSRRQTFNWLSHPGAPWPSLPALRCTPHSDKHRMIKKIIKKNK